VVHQRNAAGAAADRLLHEVAAFDAFLVGYKEHYEGIDNRSQFAGWRSTLPDHTWRELPFPHLRKAECYFFGIKK
jgi:hypothetical protein